MKFCFRLFLTTLLAVPLLLAQVPQKRELRAAWVATVGGLDWPKSTDPTTQFNTLKGIFNTLYNYKFNAVVFQVRARGNTFYNSNFEPWAAELTDSLGRTPSFDPLLVAIQEAKTLGMELHAWFNFAVVWNDTTAPTSAGRPHVAATHPEWVKRYGNQLWLDPGIPAVRDWLRMVALDLVRSYDIDAIHFDFLRIANTNFPDDDTFIQYGIPEGHTDKFEWRRENLNKFMRSFYDSVQIIRPATKVGSAPIGIHKPISGANSSFNGMNLGQDSRQWMKEGKHDYVMPQIYWNIGEQSSPVYDPDFYALAVDWQNERHGRHVYPGVAAYKMAASDRDYPVSDMIAMVDATRAIGSLGNVYFRYESLSLKNFRDVLLAGRYSTRALLPTMEWKDNIPPNRPDSVNFVKLNSFFILTWLEPEPAADGGKPIQYLVYRSTSQPVDMDDMRNLVYAGPSRSFSDLYPVFGTAAYTITALDRNHNESVRGSTVIVSADKNIVVGLEEEGVPQTFSLRQNYPNPFNPTTIITYVLPGDQRVLLRVYDVLGREIRTLADGLKGAGEHQVLFDATGLPTGVYIYRLVAGEFVESRKMQLVR